MALEDNLEDDSQLLVAMEDRLWVVHLYYKRTLQSLGLATSTNSDPHVKGEVMLPQALKNLSKSAVHGLDETPSQAHPISLQEPTMT